MNKLLEKINAMEASGAAAVDANLGARGVLHAPHNPARSAEEIRKENTINVYQNLQKIPKIKDFKFSTQENIREWLLKINNTIESISIA